MTENKPWRRQRAREHDASLRDDRRLARLRAQYADLCSQLPEAPLVERAKYRRLIDESVSAMRSVH